MDTLYDKKKIINFFGQKEKSGKRDTLHNLTGLFFKRHKQLGSNMVTGFQAGLVRLYITDL